MDNKLYVLKYVTPQHKALHTKFLCIKRKEKMHMEKVDTKQEFGQKYPSIKRESMDGSRLGQKRKGIFDNLW